MGHLVGDFRNQMMFGQVPSLQPVQAVRRDQFFFRFGKCAILQILTTILTGFRK